MSSNASQIIYDIKADVVKMAHKVCRGIAEIALSEMHEAHSDIMLSYYAGYTPVASYRFLYEDKKDGQTHIGISHGYRRTGNLRDNSLNSIGVVTRGDVAAATIQIGSMNMGSYTNSSGRVFSASGVFDLVWNQGVRGLPEGYRGHIGDVNISASPASIPISGKPGAAMDDFMEKWGVMRFPQIADMIIKSV